MAQQDVCEPGAVGNPMQFQGVFSLSLLDYFIGDEVL